jgi:hypothetical protein
LYGLAGSFNAKDRGKKPKNNGCCVCKFGTAEVGNECLMITTVLIGWRKLKNVYRKRIPVRREENRSDSNCEAKRENLARGEFVIEILLLKWPISRYEDSYTYLGIATAKPICTRYFPFRPRGVREISATCRWPLNCTFCLALYIYLYTDRTFIKDMPGYEELCFELFSSSPSSTSKYESKDMVAHRYEVYMWREGQFVKDP